MEKNSENTIKGDIKTLNIIPFWHKTSYDKFLNERLPALLAARLPLSGYQIEETNKYVCNVKATFSSINGDVKIEYADIPRPDGEGIFEINGKRLVVVPTASCEDLGKADILCVGEQIYNHIEEHLGEAPHDLPWNEPLARAWLPLDKWIREFLQSKAQRLDDLNWLAKFNHLRRITFRDALPIEKRGKIFESGYFGRACPFETPEGPNICHVLSIAIGAEIRAGKLVIVDDRPEAGLGFTASMVPFLEHNDSNRQLIGVNLMRQWFAPPDPEPALVQTGNEPDTKDFWCGRNLLTAFVSWGEDTFEDGLVISQSAAKRLNFPQPIEPGDMLSNRHGTKGVVGRIMPDDGMPHLADGTPIELVYNFIGCQTRLNHGQIREAIMGRIAHMEGQPALAPPFHAPDESELRERLKNAHLSESGMEVLAMGHNGRKLQRPSAVGWVYWGRTNHIARDKIHTSVSSGAQRMGELEYYALREVKAFENIRECFNTRFAGRPDAGKVIPSAEQTAEVLKLNACAAAGKVEQAKAPTPKFSELVRRLVAAGIRAEFKDDKLTLKFARPEGNTIKLARPVAHPWLRAIQLSETGVFEELPQYGMLAEANDKLERMLKSSAPDVLTQKAFAFLETRVKEFFDALVNPEHLRFALGGRVFFSARAILAPGKNLCLDQVGIAEQIAWDLFGPLVTREVGKEDEVRNRTPRAAKTLDEIMARSWVILNRAPTLTPTCLLAFHPVRLPEKVIRLHPLACRLMNTDFDGDQAAVYLPITDEAQREAGERLSVAGHLKRDPDLIRLMVPPMEPLWGLASLSLTKAGKEEVQKLVGTEITMPEGFVTKVSLEAAVQTVLKRDGVEKTLAMLDCLMRRGFEAVKESGASINPFIGISVLSQSRRPEGDGHLQGHLGGPGAPRTADAEGLIQLTAYADEVREWIASNTDFTDGNIGPQILAVKSNARGTVHQLLRLISSPGMIPGISGKPIIIRNGYCEGLTPEEMYAAAAIAREGFLSFILGMEERGDSLRATLQPKGFNVLARALRSDNPGLVFARAAANGETDPLTDVDSRLFVGLPVKKKYYEIYDDRYRKVYDAGMAFWRFDHGGNRSPEAEISKTIDAFL